MCQCYSNLSLLFINLQCYVPIHLELLATVVTENVLLLGTVLGNVVVVTCLARASFPGFEPDLRRLALTV